MAQQLIGVGTAPNDGQGNPIRTAFIKSNDNFSELYARVQTSPPTSLIGTIGDTAGMYAYDSTSFYYCFADFDGSSVIWGEIAEAGNIAVSAISSGSSNVKIADISGNATTSIAGTANVIVVATTGQFVTGVVSATGNITSNFFLGNGSQLSGLPETYNNANVTALLATFGSNTVSTTGNISTGNINTTQKISATGNITTAGFFVGDFVGNIVANITNIPGPGGAVVFNNGAGNAAATAGLVFDNSGPNVLTVDGALSATGNVIGGNVVATGITGTLATAAQPNITSVGSLTSVSVVANVQGGNLRTAGQMSALGNVSGGNVLVNTDVQVGGNVSAGQFTGTTVSVTGNISGGNLRTVGQVSATGNITGNFFLGNGSQLTGINTTSIQNGNSNVRVSSNADISISVAGVSPVAVFESTGLNITGILSVTGNVLAGNISAITHTGITMSASGNVTGGNVLTGGIISGTANVTGGNVTTAGLVTATGNVTGGNVTTAGLVTATGNVTGGNLSVGTGLITVGNIVNGNGNGVGNIGTSTTFFNTVFAKATSAQYADLAENYVADADYAPGTVVVFAGSAEITICSEDADTRVAGVISTHPAHLMNAGQPGLPVALRGRVPVKVAGPVIKGDSLVTSATAGHAQSVGTDKSHGQAVFAKALETDASPGAKIITAVIL